MELEEIIKELQDIGFSLSGTDGKIECYLFGSILTKNSVPSDVDLLIVYQYESQLAEIKQRFTFMARQYPLHVTYLNFSEEKEFNFIYDQRGLKVFCLP